MVRRCALSPASVRRSQVMFRVYLEVARFQALRQPVEVEIDHRSGEEGQHLREDESADDADAEGHAEFRAYAASEGERKAAEKRGQGGHQNWSEAQETSLEDGIFCRFPFLALGLER